MDKLMYRASKIKDGYILVGENFLARDTRPVLTPRTALGFLRAVFVMFIYHISPKGRDKLLIHDDQWGQIYSKSNENKSVALGIKKVLKLKQMESKQQFILRKEMVKKRTRGTSKRQVRMSCQKDHL